MLPAGRVLGGELLVRPHELPELRMRLVEHLEANAVRRALDLDAARIDAGQTGHVDVQHGLPGWRRGLAPFAVKVSGSKPFRSVKRHDSSVVVGMRQRAVALEQLSPGHASPSARSAGGGSATLPSGSFTKPMWQTPLSSMPMTSPPGGAELVDRRSHVGDAERDASSRSRRTAPPGSRGSRTRASRSGVSTSASLCSLSGSPSTSR